MGRFIFRLMPLAVAVAVAAAAAAVPAIGVFSCCRL